MLLFNNVNSTGDARSDLVQMTARSGCAESASIARAALSFFFRKEHGAYAMPHHYKNGLLSFASLFGNVRSTAQNFCELLGVQRKCMQADSIPPPHK